MTLIIGLGNPGLKYAKTRHNVGFMAIDAFCEKYQIELSQVKFNSLCYIGTINNERVLIIKPQTYMNLSGEAISQFMKYYQIATTDILVIYDDMSLPCGKIKIKGKGSSAGQNGLKSIIAHLHTNVFPRIKIGIDKNPLVSMPDYVLGKFSQEQEQLVKQSLEQTITAIEDFLILDIQKMMNKFNVKDKKSN